MSKPLLVLVDMAELSKLWTAVKWHVWLPVEMLFEFLWRADTFCIGRTVADDVTEGTDHTLIILNLESIVWCGSWFKA